MDAYDWPSKRAKELESEAAGLKPHEIEMLSLKYVLEHQNMWPENVDEGAYQFGTPRESLGTVLKIVLRDEVLKLEGLQDEASF